MFGTLRQVGLLIFEPFDCLIGWRVHELILVELGRFFHDFLIMLVVAVAVVVCKDVL